MMRFNVVTERIQHLVTYMEMGKSDFDQIKVRDQKLAKPLSEVQVYELDQIDLDLYWSLYDEIGREWRWTARKLMTDSTVAEILDDPFTKIFILKMNDKEVGFAEIKLEKNAAECVYFGIIGSCRGKGLGRYFLQTVIEALFCKFEINRFWLHTCEFDHPRAIDVYKKSGFSIKSQKLELADIILPD